MILQLDLNFNFFFFFFYPWTNVNPGYNNQKIAYSKDNGNTFTDIDFTQGVWTYVEIDEYIKEQTKDQDNEGKDVFPITLEFDQPTFRAIITLQTNYQLD